MKTLNTDKQILLRIVECSGRCSEISCAGHKGNKDNSIPCPFFRDHLTKSASTPEQNLRDATEMLEEIEREARLSFLESLQ